MSKTTVCERSNRDLLGVFTNIGQMTNVPSILKISLTVLKYQNPTNLSYLEMFGTKALVMVIYDTKIKNTNYIITLNITHFG